MGGNVVRSSEGKIALQKKNLGHLQIFKFDDVVSADLIIEHLCINSQNTKKLRNTYIYSSTKDKDGVLVLERNNEDLNNPSSSVETTLSCCCLTL